ncbi:MAG TPA: hypothetical protein EYQ82_07760 [Dehalococcoidia bacterium]|nr:hypothetical protein [Dehalococcoidia bacterium]HIK98631.1 hypothetical protein [Dehalococcoidia bacterium]
MRVADLGGYRADDEVAHARNIVSLIRLCATHTASGLAIKRIVFLLRGHFYDRAHSAPTTVTRAISNRLLDGNDDRRRHKISRTLSSTWPDFP